MTDMRIFTNHKSRVTSRLDLVAAAREGVFWGNWLLAFNGHEGGLGFFLESGDRGEGGLQLHITLATPAYFFF